MYTWFPLHQTPVTYFGTQIPLPLMKTKTNFLASNLFAYLVLALMILFAIFYVTESSINFDSKVFSEPTHHCVGTSHSSCDGMCECDGIECN